MTNHEPQIVDADQVEKEAFVMLGMAENIRNGLIQATREPGGMICYQITDKGRAMVEAMGR